MTNPMGNLGGDLGGYIQLGAVLVEVLGASIPKAQALVRTVKDALHPGMSEDQMNEILKGVADDAARRKALADADAVAADAKAAETSSHAVGAMGTADHKGPPQ